MATPIGHTLVAGILYFTGRRSLPTGFSLLVLYGLFANAPDLDFLPGILIGKANAFHHGISHSLGMGLIFAAVVTTVLVKTSQRFAQYGLLRLMLIGFILYASHIVVDYITLDNSYPFGMPIFWPITSQYFHAPLYIFPNVLHSSASALSVHNLFVAGRELVVFAPPMLFLMFANRRFLTPVRGLWGLGITVYLGVVLALFINTNPYF